VIAFVLFYVPKKILAFISAISLLLMAMLFGDLLWAGRWLPMMEIFNDEDPFVFWAPTGVPEAAGVFLFCFAGHPCIPDIYGSAKKPKRFPYALASGFAFAGIYYGCCGAFGYCLYGRHLDKSFTSNLGNNLMGMAIKGQMVFPLIAAVGLLVKLLGAFPIFAGPILTTFGLKDKGSLVLSLVRVAFLVLTCSCALGLKHLLNVVLSMTGLLATMATSVIFPSLAYIRIVKPPPITRASLYMLCFVATSCAITGTVQVVLDQT
jgi:vesicular inhibitory amino acid transporter